MQRFSFRPGLELRGRQFRGLSGFAGKPLHPPLTDLTVGAYVIGPAFDLIAFLFPNSSWAPELFEAGGWVVLAGALTSLATALTGFADWLRTVKGTQIRRMANAHAITMITLTLVVLIDLYYRYLAEGGEYSRDPSAVSSILALGILGLVIIGGTLGGSLTYDWGMSVETRADHRVYHPSDRDLIHPHDEQPSQPAGDQEVVQPEDQGTREDASGLPTLNGEHRSNEES
jgi:uncharacterized membrane protein